MAYTGKPFCPAAPPAGPVQPPIANPVAPPAKGPLAKSTLAPEAPSTSAQNAPSNLQLRAKLATREILNPLAPTADFIQPPFTGGGGGTVGPQGPTGPVGPAGATGPAGIQGATGAAGPTGPAGPKGATGPAGPNGAQGTPGAAGAVGATGATGAAGPIGPAGPAGPAGATGPQGQAGTGVDIKGSVPTSSALPTTGNTIGDAYITVDTGHLWTWNGSTWVDGGNITGPAGPAGPVGPTGPAGPTGATGPAGPNGPTGPVGATGAAGQAGPTGGAGPTGPTGPAGAQGPQGAQGLANPAPPNMAVQWNNNGNFGGDANFIWNTSTQQLLCGGNAGANGPVVFVGVPVGNFPDAQTGNTQLIVGPIASPSNFGEITVCGNSTTQYATIGSINFANFANTAVEKRIAVISGVVPYGGNNFYGGIRVQGAYQNTLDPIGVYMVNQGAGVTDMGLGTKSPNCSFQIVRSGTSAKIFLQTDAGNSASSSFTGWSYIGNGGGNNICGVQISGYVARGSMASNTTPLAGDVIVDILGGAGGSDNGRIRIVCEGTWATGVIPTAIVFRTCTSSGNSEAERMRITNAGNVGIGTAAPQSELEINGLARITGLGTVATSGQGLEMFYNVSSGTVQCYNRGAANYTPLNLAGAPLLLNTGGGGNVGIGLSIPTYQLQLSTDSAAKPSTNTWTIASDIRTKQNVRRFEGDIEVIRRLEPIVGEYNGLGGTPKGQRVVSFDAEELREIVPQCVSSVKSKLRADDEEETDLLGVNTHELFFHMIRAVQELDRRIAHFEDIPTPKTNHKKGK